MHRVVLSVLAVVVLAASACGGGPDDQAIATEIKARFFSIEQLKTANLQVSSQAGVVTLAGEVPSEGARYQAFKLATEAKGVVRVEDRMSVAVARLAPPEPEKAPPPPPPPAPPIIKRSVSKPAPAKPAGAPVPSREMAPASAAEPPLVAPSPPPPPQPVQVEVPAGTSLVIRMVDAIDTEVNKAGETFRGTLDVPLVVDGKTVAAAGSDVTVEITEAKSAGRMAGRSELHLQAVRLVVQGESYSITTDSYSQAGSSEGKKTATKAGAGAAAGAVIGAIAGGGKGAAIGAVIGAGAGTAAASTKKGEQIRVPSETRLTFHLDAPLTVTYTPGQDKSRRNR